MNDEQVLLNGQLENEDQTSVSTMAGNDALAESGVSDTSSFLSEKIRSMITAPDFRHSDPHMSERDIQRRSAQPWIAPQDYAVARGSTFAQDQTSDRWTIAKDAAKRFGMEMLTLGNKAEIVAGQLLAKTGSTIGEEMQKRAYDVLDSQMAQMGRTYENVEDLNTWTSDIISGAGSMLELFAVGLATGGTGALAIQGIDAMGGGTYNNMRKYADEHDGSIDGFEGNWTDIGIDLANATLQVAIEKYLGFGRKDLFAPLGKKRWFKGALDKFAKEAVAGVVQEGTQALTDDISEYAKGNIDAVDNWQGYMRAAVLGGIMQGALAGAMQKFSRAKADAMVEEMATSAMLAKEPNANISEVKKKAKSFAQKFNDDVEDGLVKNMWDEFADRIDTNNDRGKVRDKLVSEFTKARVAALGLESADELDADDLADIQDAATVAAGEALRESFTQGKPIEQTLTARLVADGKDLVVRDLTPEERGVREISRVDLQADEDALAQQIGTARESLARARLETELQAQQTALEEERARRKADVEELQAWAEQQVRLGEEIGRRRERGQTEFSLREINRWLRQSSRSEQARAREERKSGQVRERKKEMAQKPLPKESTPKKVKKEVKPETPKQSQQQGGIIFLTADQANDLLREYNEMLAYKGADIKKIKDKELKESVKNLQERLRDIEYNIEYIKYYAGQESSYSPKNIAEVMAKWKQESATKQPTGVATEITKSKKRVRESAEVYTPKWVVNEMLDLIPKETWENIDATFLEPAGGNGNFVEEILRRKLAIAKNDEEKIRALKSVYAVELMLDNVDEMRARVKAIMEENGITTGIDDIIKRNIQQGNFLTGENIFGEDISFYDWINGETDTLKAMLARGGKDVANQQSLQNIAKGIVSDTGRGAYNSRYQRIILNKDSDVSTILHELSHMWLNNWFKAYRAENAPESFRKWWRPVERALGIRESDRFLDQDASEKFARSFEKWVLDGGKGAESSLAPVYERLSKRLADIYDDLATRYFDMVADLKPEVQSWFAKNEALADSMIVDVPERNEETGETTTEQVRVQYRDRAAERETAQKMAETEEKAERTADRAADEINEITENVAGEQLAPDSDEPAQSPYTAEGQREQRTSQRIKEEASAEGVLIEARKYDPLMAKRAAEDAVIFATTDLDSAFEVAMGRKNAPGDVPRIAVFFAVKNRLMLNPAENVARLQELAKDSPVITELSEAGKKLRMAGVAMSKDDPLRILRDLSKMYDKNLTAEERAKITENINQINEYIKRADLNLEDTWNKILSDMECK